MGNEGAYRGIEIGCLAGEFDAYLLERIAGLYMTTIDPYPLWPDVFKNNADTLNRLRILPLTSDEAVHILKPEYHFVFIDGDHSYEQCKRDILNYLPLIMPGGFLSGHNYHDHPDSAHPGVHKAVKELLHLVQFKHENFVWYIDV